MIKSIQEKEQKEVERNRKAVVVYMRKQKDHLIGELAEVVFIHRAMGFFIQA